MQARRNGREDRPDSGEPAAGRPAQLGQSPATSGGHLPVPGAGRSPAGGTDRIVGLQRVIGNRAVTGLLDRRTGAALRTVQRRTAQEIIDSYRDWGGLNLREDALATELVAMCRAGSYGAVLGVFDLLDGVDRDDVAQEMVQALTVVQLITAARSGDGQRLLSLMASELAGGWATEDELNKARVVRAVTGDEAARFAHNRARILVVKQNAGTDLEALAQLFADDEIIDDGSVPSRLTAVLSATEHLAIPGLQTGVDFSDTGFAGDRTPNGPGFRDPHPSSQNQVGHFLTAAGLQFSPDVVARRIPYFGSIREMVRAPGGMPDQEVALRLTIGHEKGPDPNTVGAFVSIAVAGGAAYFTDGPEGETEQERDERIGRAIATETGRQVRAIIAAFRAQFQACTDADVAAWNDAVTALGVGATLNMSAAEVPLGRIAVDPRMRGNSRQDLRLSLVGWRFGQLIQGGRFADRYAAAGWLRVNLGPH